MRNSNWRFKKYWTIAEAGSRLFGVGIKQSYELFRGGVIRTSGRFPNGQLRVNIASMLQRLSLYNLKPTAFGGPFIYTQNHGHGSGSSETSGDWGSSVWAENRETEPPASSDW
jgi:hypothetical protein